MRHKHGDNWVVNPEGLLQFVKSGTIEGTPEAMVYHDEIVKEFLPDYTRQKINFPAAHGKVLDEYSPNWADVQSQRTYPENTAFFTKARKAEAHEEIAIMLNCAEQSGIRDKMFLGFGGSLGYAWVNDFLPKDDDIDICFLPVPQEQRYDYLMRCKDAGLCKTRLHGPESINGEYAWFSLGRKSPYTENGVKSCNWFWFHHGGYWWHSKGKAWAGKKELHAKYSTSKGIPDIIFNGELREVSFGGNRINIPKNLGKCLDWWYPKWIFREQKSSAPSAILVHPDEADSKTWFIERR